MATKTTEKGGTMLLLLDPDDPKLIVDEGINGRFLPYEREDLEDLVQDIARNGIIQNLEAIKTGKDSYKLTVGFRRYKAAGIIKAEKLSPFPVKLPIKVIEADEKEAFLRNISENLIRRPPTVFDNAHNMSRMLKFGYSNQEVADYYKTSKATVVQTLKALRFTREEQIRFTRQQLAGGTVAFLADHLPDPKVREEVMQEAAVLQQDAAIQEAAQAEGVDLEGAKQLIEEAKASTAPTDTPADVEEKVEAAAKKRGIAPPKAKRIAKKVAATKKAAPELRHIKQAAETKKAISDKRTRKLSDLRALFSELSAGGRTGVPVELRRVCMRIDEWVDGQIGTEELKTQLFKQFGATYQSKAA